MVMLDTGIEKIGFESQQSLTIGCRNLVMNFHVVQFQYGFELIGLTYPQKLYKRSRISSDGIFVIDNRISSHLVSNS